MALFRNPAFAGLIVIRKDGTCIPHRVTTSSHSISLFALPLSSPLFNASPLPLYSPYPSAPSPFVHLLPFSPLPSYPFFTPPPYPSSSFSLPSFPSSPVCTSNHLSFSPLLYSPSPLLTFSQPDFTPALPLPTLPFHTPFHLSASPHPSSLHQQPHPSSLECWVFSLTIINFTDLN